MRRDRLRPGHPHAFIPRGAAGTGDPSVAVRRVLRALNRAADGDGRCTLDTAALVDAARISRLRAASALDELLRDGAVERAGAVDRPALILHRAPGFRA